jgi:hypothetical protein
MKTVKLPLKEPIEINSYLKEYNKVLRISYNLFKDGLKEKEIRLYLKTYQLDLTLVDSWFVQSAIYEAKSLVERTEGRKIIFGGKKNFELLKQKKITKAGWKALRTYPITLIGEAPQGANRKFSFDLVNETIIFKPSKGIKIACKLPHLHKNLRKEFKLLQTAIENKELAVTIRLSNTQVWLTYDETKLQKPVKTKPNRFLAIDLNPNSYGFSIVENDNILKTEIIDFKELTKKTRKASSSKESLYQTNKRVHETFQVNKYLVEQAKHFQCEALVLEALGTSKMKSFRPVNRLVKNQWSPGRIQSNLKGKYHVVEVGAWYSSTMGNICYGHQYPDAIASSIELARRAGEMKETGNWNYPEIPSRPLTNQWKEESKVVGTTKDWKSFHNWLKTSKLKYRSSVSAFASTVLRLNSRRSTVNLISFGKSYNV